MTEPRDDNHPGRCLHGVWKADHCWACARMADELLSKAPSSIARAVAEPSKPVSAVCALEGCQHFAPSASALPDNCPIPDCVAVCSFPDDCAAPVAAPEVARAQHWVFAAAEAHRPLVCKQALAPGCDYAREHLLEMLNKIKAGMSSTKACRWLGWIQGCLNVTGVATLDELKAINRAASDSQDGPGGRNG